MRDGCQRCLHRRTVSDFLLGFVMSMIAQTAACSPQAQDICGGAGYLATSFMDRVLQSNMHWITAKLVSQKAGKMATFACLLMER